MIPDFAMTEAAIVCDLFVRLAAGSTVMAECRRLDALGLPPARRYKDRQLVRQAVQWHPHRLIRLLRNPVYYGMQETHSRHGVIRQPVPALVAETVWRAVQVQLAENRTLPGPNARRLYPLRGLLHCGQCGTRYTGETLRPHGAIMYYYRCGQRRVKSRAGMACHNPRARAEQVEVAVWQWCQKTMPATSPGCGTSLPPSLETLRHVAAQQLQKIRVMARPGGRPAYALQFTACS